MDYSNKSDALIKDVLYRNLSTMEYCQYLDYMEAIYHTPGDTPAEQIEHWAMENPESVASYAALIFKVDTIMRKYLLVTNV